MNTINWLSMFLSSITPLVIGLIYFHKNVFGKVIQYAAAASERKPNKVVIIVLTLVFSFFISFFLLNFNNDGINQEGDFDTFAHGVWHGVFVAITLVTPVVVISGIIGRLTWKNILAMVFYWIICLALMGGIMDAMNHWENITLT